MSAFTDAQGRTMLLTIGRAGRVLDLFSLDHPEWGATAVARELDIAKSQAHELLVSLTDIGLLQRVRPGRYGLGKRILTLQSVVLDQSDLGRVTCGVMRTLVDRFGETVQLAMWGPGAAICVAAYEGTHAVAIAPWPVGGSVPAHCTGAGKVLLASRPWAEVHELLACNGAARLTARTIVSSGKLCEELADVRRRGLAFEDKEYAPDTCGVAVPILNVSGDVVAALGISVSEHRWQRRQQHYARALMAAAGQVSRLAGRPASDEIPCGVPNSRTLH